MTHQKLLKNINTVKSRVPMSLLLCLGRYLRFIANTEVTDLKIA